MPPTAADYAALRAYLESPRATVIADWPDFLHPHTFTNADDAGDEYDAASVEKLLAGLTESAKRAVALVSMEFLEPVWLAWELAFEAAAARSDEIREAMLAATRLQVFRDVIAMFRRWWPAEPLPDEWPSDARAILARFDDAEDAVENDFVDIYDAFVGEGRIDYGFWGEVFSLDHALIEFWWAMREISDRRFEDAWFFFRVGHIAWRRAEALIPAAAFHLYAIELDDFEAGSVEEFERLNPAIIAATARFERRWWNRVRCRLAVSDVLTAEFA